MSLPNFFIADQRHAMLGRDAGWHRAASTVDGYDELVTQHERLMTLPPAPPALDETVTHKAAAIDLLNGADIDQLAAAAREDRLALIEAGQREQIVTKAWQQLEERAALWVSKNEARIAESHAQVLQGIVAETIVLVHGDLAGVETAADLGRNPHAAMAWAKFYEFVEQFNTAYATAGLISNVADGRRPLLGLFADYERAFPNFWHTEARAWFLDIEPAKRLRTIAQQKLRVTCRTWPQIQQEHARLDVLAKELAEQEWKDAQDAIPSVKIPSYVNGESQ